MLKANNTGHYFNPLVLSLSLGYLQAEAKRIAKYIQCLDLISG